MTIKNIRPHLLATIDSGIFKGSQVSAVHYIDTYRPGTASEYVSRLEETCVFYHGSTNSNAVTGDYNDFGAIVASLSAGLLYSEDDVTTVVTS
jgi:hypothetical protein